VGASRGDRGTIRLADRGAIRLADRGPIRLADRGPSGWPTAGPSAALPGGTDAAARLDALPPAGQPTLVHLAAYCAVGCTNSPGKRGVCAFSRGEGVTRRAAGCVRLAAGKG